MTRKKLFWKIMKYSAIALVVFTVFFSVFLGILTEREVSKRREDATSRLDILGEHYMQATEQIFDKLNARDRERAASLGLLKVLLETVDHPVDFSETKALGGWETISVLDRDNNLVSGDPLDFSDEHVSKGVKNINEMLNAYPEEEAETIDYIEEKALMWAAYWLNDGNYIVGVCDITSEQEELVSEFNRIFQKQGQFVGEQDLIICYNTENRILYCSDSEKQEAFDADTLNRIKQGGRISFQGKRYVIANETNFTEEYGYSYSALLLIDSIKQQWVKVVVVYSALYTFVLLLLISFVNFQQKDEERGLLISKSSTMVFGVRVYKIAARRMIRLVMTACVILFLCGAYIQTFSAASTHRIDSAVNLYNLEKNMEQNYEKAQQDIQEYDAGLVAITEQIARILKEAPELCTQEGLQKLADAAQVNSIYVFNKYGKTEMTNTVFFDFSLSQNEADQSYAFWSVVHGYESVCVQGIRTDDTVWHQEMQYVGVARKDKQGMVQIGKIPEDYRKGLEVPIKNFIVEMPTLKTGAFVFYVDEQNQVQEWPDSNYNDGAPSRLGLTETEMQDGFTGYQWLADRLYFITCRLIYGRYVYIAMPRSMVHGDDLAQTVLVSLVGFGIMALMNVFMMLFLLLWKRKHHRKEPSDSNKKPQNGLVAVYERFDRKSTYEKLQQLVGVFLGASILALILYYLYMDKQEETSSMLAYVLSCKWDHAVNIFSITYILWTISTVYFIARFINHSMHWIMGIMSTRARTVGALIGNLIEYASAFGALFYCLPLIGFNLAAVVATASFISFGLTFGAQELIKDFLSGMFIIFEDSLRVGDWVEIGDCKGYVEEIGLRMTTVVMAGGVSTVIHNSAVNRFTRRAHLATIHIQVDNAENLHLIRQALLLQLYRFSSNIPEIIAEPYLERKDEKDNIVTVCAQCRKEDVDTVEYELGNIVKRTLKLAGITGWNFIEKEMPAE